MVRIITLIKKHKYPLIILLLVLVLGVYFYVSSQKKPAVRYVNVMRGVIISEIGVTGTIKPPHSLDLKFQTAGRIRNLYARVGNQVSAGTTLAVLALKQFVGVNFAFAFPLSGAILGLVVSSSIGFIFGIFPARRASLKSPVEALRYE